MIEPFPHLPPWGRGYFPSLSLPNEQRGNVSLWAGDEGADGVSVSIMWNMRNGDFDVKLYIGSLPSNWDFITVSDLLTVKMIATAHFEKHKKEKYQP